MDPGRVDPVELPQPAGGRGRHDGAHQGRLGECGGILGLDDVAWFLAPEEAVDVIERHGFTFEEQEWSDLPMAEQPRSYSRTYRVWSYVLRV